MLSLTSFSTILLEMKRRELVFVVAAVVALTLSTFSQGTVVVHDPTKDAPEVKLTQAEQALFDSAMPAVAKHVPSEGCDTETRETSGVAHGSFTRAGARQTLIFYQYCQTGNGLGWVGLLLIEGGKVVGNYISDAGWSNGIETVPDVNQNGLNEFTLALSGGIHQGEGGVGVDLMEFSAGLPRGLGWYKAEEFSESQTGSAWKLTARPGKPPIFYKQKFLSGENQKYRPRGGAVATKLGSPYSKFEQVK
jgi:hypothetical protein